MNSATRKKRASILRILRRVSLDLHELTILSSELYIPTRDLLRTTKSSRQRLARAQQLLKQLQAAMLVAIMNPPAHYHTLTLLILILTLATLILSSSRH